MTEEKKEKVEQEKENFELGSWISDLSRISLLAEFIEDAFRENCDCKVCRKLRERAKRFVTFTQQLPKF